MLLRPCIPPGQGIRRAVRTALVCVLVAAAGAGPAAVVAAAPGDPPPPLGLEEIGSSPTVTFLGQQGQVSLSIPVPQNLTPAELRGTANLPAFVTGGQVDVMQGDRLVSRTEIDPRPSAPIVIPLDGLRVTDNAADLTLRTYLTVDGICRFTPDTAFRITDSTVTFTGRESIPRTVSEFLPPVLRNLTIIVPDDVNGAEGAAAVDLAAAVTAHYGTATTGIDAVGRPRSDLRPATAPGPLQRQIVIDSDADTGLTLRSGPGGSTYLVIGGPEDQLEVQTQLLTSDLASIAMSSSAVAGPLYDAPQVAMDVQRLSDLGVADQQVISSSWPSIAFGIDQTRLGRASRDVRVQLIGSYAPAGGDGTVLSVRVGNRVLATLPTDSSGTFNAWVDIPGDVMKRYTEVTVTLERGGVQEGCGTGTRSSLSLSAAGEVSTALADPPSPAGFDSVPQSMMPWVQLAWTHGDVDDVARGVALVAGLAHLSSVPLGIDVVPMSEAVSSELPAILIAADGEGLPDLPLPVSSDGSTVTVRSASGSTSRVTLTPQIRYGAVQVAQQGGRTVLVANSTADAADLDRLLTWLSAEDRWQGVNGDAVIQVSGRQPVYVDSASAVSVPADDSSFGIGAATAVVVGVIVGAMIVAAVVILLVRLRRRTTPRG
ncbi:hypothetical protein [Gordonia desulfuricans]|uniref:hypothetical protein n=1 Tax=Gordonia desulfuricans TaxID=89051 RepID=UPI00073E26BC|nr:hypothetical protein [Gordonia desulfuricans]